MRLNYAGKYCDITLKIIEMLQNVCENCVWTVSSACSLSCEKVKETGILIDKPRCEKPKTVRTSENITAVVESVLEAPSTSIHSRSQQLNISKTPLRRNLDKDLRMISGVEAN